MENQDRKKKLCYSQHRCTKEEFKELNRNSLFDFQSPAKRIEKPFGGVAQLGEHLPCKQGVKSSNLFISTRGESENSYYTGS